MSSPQDLPVWLNVLLKTRFYGACAAHSGLRRNELNLFDTNSMRKICQHCQPSKSAAVLIPNTLPVSGPADDTIPPALLHISRYMYHDVVLLREAAAWFDVAHIQPYMNNGHRVLYLDRSSQPKSRLAPNAASCKVCDRTLQHPYLYCSLRCKLAPNLVGLGETHDDGAAAETCPNTPQSSLGSAGPNSPACLALPPAGKRLPVSHGELGRLLPSTDSYPVFLAPRKSSFSNPGSSMPPSSNANSYNYGYNTVHGKAMEPSNGARSLHPPRKDQGSRSPVGGSGSPLALSTPSTPVMGSDIRKSKRKGRPIHSPAAGPKTFMLLRQTLQPLLL